MSLLMVYLPALVKRNGENAKKPGWHLFAAIVVTAVNSATMLMLAQLQTNCWARLFPPFEY
jgi:hypothetical protein